MMGTHLNDQVAIVSGGGGTIGGAIARGLAAEGAKVVVLDYGGPATQIGAGTKSPADAIVAGISAAGGTAVAAYGNVADEQAVVRVVEETLLRWNRIDVIVHAAGIVDNRPLTEIPASAWDEMLAVHLKGGFLLAKHVIPAMRRQQYGRLIFVASEAAWGGFGVNFLPSYAAAKAGLLGLMMHCATTYYKDGITANAIWPRAASRLSAASVGATSLPADPEMGPEHNVPATLYLASREASWVNGAIFWLAPKQIRLVRRPEIEITLQWEGPWDIDRFFARFEPTFARAVPARPKVDKSGLINTLEQAQE